MLPINYQIDDPLHQIIRKFYSGSLNFVLKQEDINNLTWNKQEEFLNATLNRTLIHKYPMKNKFVKLFLKKLIEALEGTQEVHDDLYKYLCKGMNDESDEFYYRHYIIGYELSNIITIRETNNMVVNGTTGMKTWEAAIMLADWALCHKEIFRQKKILELGSGIGFTGIALAKFCEPDTIMMSDCHNDVLKTIKENIVINFDCSRENTSNGVIIKQENKKITIGAMNLDWTSTEDLSLDFYPDIIIGADIVYDPSILKPLCEVIKVFVDKNKAIEVYIAGVVRNQETYNKFLLSLESAQLRYQKLHQENSIYIDWTSDSEFYLLKISGS